jgi:ATP-dependent Clp protease ATP-binding subunit ClpA
MMNNFEEIRKKVMGHLVRQLKPEFINRIDDVIIFNPLDREVLN